MSDTNFEKLVEPLKALLTQHHTLYSSTCKDVYAEELFAKALIASGYGTDWKPDGNHGVGKDQTTDCGIKISNKSGQLVFGNKDSKRKIKSTKLKINGSRLTTHKTLEEKLEFLKIKHQDFILSLATSAKDWKSGKKIYHLIVINSDDLDYHNAVWEDTIGVRGGGKGKVVGHKCVGNGYTAKIQKSMSDQLWTDIDESLFKVIYEIVI